MYTKMWDAIERSYYLSLSWIEYGRSFTGIVETYRIFVGGDDILSIVVQSFGVNGYGNIGGYKVHAFGDRDSLYPFKPSTSCLCFITLAVMCMNMLVVGESLVSFEWLSLWSSLTRMRVRFSLSLADAKKKLKFTFPVSIWNWSLD